MGIEKGKYDVELIRRTKELIQDYDGKYNLTLLMNGLLSLIVLPQEHNSRIRKLTFMNTDLNDIPEIKFVLESPRFYFDRRGFNNDLKNLMKRIRNGISHQRIETINTKGKWKGVKIQDLDRHNNVGLNLELKTSELRKFAFFIADEYIKEVRKASG
ncbi:conserved protein of unknown function [Tenacibaculum sp. 190130A14a]|uniref:pEK499-p136 HEPN domain-containing protein n=1 Tax=Tenacibaculum polynesiense TaxID=3137857 RepID=A0ABM9P7Y6_9FLAO